MPGGVCAVLDYEVELMAEYVAEMTTRLAMGTSRAPDSFRKFISQILSSTRLPRTTILLGMNYFAKRINMMNMMSPAKLTLSEGHVWRLLTVALLLGSKFLDDNTFQNRSWADVSGIPVRELNKLEREWMEAINWCLYVNLDRSEDYTAWINSWRDWEAGKKRMQRLASMTIPIDTEYANNVARHNTTVAYNTWHQEQIAEYERLTRVKRNEQAMQQNYRHEQSCWPYQPQPDLWSAAPLTPPDSGYGTPEYMNSAATMNTPYDDWFNQQAQQANRAVANGAYGATGRQQQYPITANPTPYHSRNFPAKLPAYNFYGHNIWENSVDHTGSGMNCAPHGHMGKQASYFGAHPYGQPVMG
ncbi:cyclin-like protein [Sporothrix eucalyptigena]|uniref:Cyclin-like protein n=1 Tax=Sporothrix eucalyptigena TaxID=1812306 RepID=A0ABP0CMV3_9PEZI